MAKAKKMTIKKGFVAKKSTTPKGKKKVTISKFKMMKPKK